MRLLIVGTLKGQLTTATKIAMDNGASVTHAEDHEQAMRVLRGGKGADLLLVDVALDIRDLVMRLEAELDRDASDERARLRPHLASCISPVQYPLA
jgi:CheY-like chemotaxis protein